MKLATSLLSVVAFAQAVTYILDSLKKQQQPTLTSDITKEALEDCLNMGFVEQTLDAGMVITDSGVKALQNMNEKYPFSKDQE